MNLGRRIREYKRIIKIARKPTKKEFLTTLKITGIGTLLIGVIGFVIQTVFSIFAVG